MVITSKQNSTVKKISQLKEKKFRKEYNLFVVEGTKPVRECEKSGLKIDTVVCTPSRADEFLNAVVVSEDVFRYLSEEKTPQGVLAAVEIPKLDIRPPKDSCILLNGLQDPGNLGTIIRTANAAGYGEIYLINCTDPYSQKAVRASMSGIFFVNVYNGDKGEVLSALNGVPLIAADMAGEDIFSFKPPKKYCLCIGGEGNGLDEEIKNLAAYTVKIPMRSSCESLNAAVSAGIAMYQLKINA